MHNAKRKQRCRLSGIRVVSTRESSRATRSLVRVNNSNNRSISTTDHEESTGDNNKDAESNHEVPLHIGITLALGPVVIQPHEAVQLERHERAEQGTNEGDKTTKDRNTGGDQVGDDGGDDGASEPSSPVDSAVGGEMLCSAEEADEDVFGGEVNDEDGCREKAGEGDAVGDALDKMAG